MSSCTHHIKLEFRSTGNPLKVGNFYHIQPKGGRNTLVQVVSQSAAVTEVSEWINGERTVSIIHNQILSSYKIEEVNLPDPDSLVALISTGKEYIFVGFRPALDKPIILSNKNGTILFNVPVGAIKDVPKTLFINSVCETFTDDNLDDDVWYFCKPERLITKAKLRLICEDDYGYDAATSEIFRSRKGVEGYIKKNLQAIFPTR